MAERSGTTSTTTGTTGPTGGGGSSVGAAHDDAGRVRAAVAAGQGARRADLEALVRIAGVSADPAAAPLVRAGADAVAALLTDLGLDVAVLTARGPAGARGAPAVVGRRPAPPGAPTVLLYAHHDVQPPGDPAGWTTPAFEPTERKGRLYGRGTADDKAGVVVHVGALRAVLPLWGPDEGVGVTVFVEGEEEVGSPTFAAFLREHRDLVRADVVVVADSANAAVDTPSLTTSLRGLVGASLTVRTLDHALHSGLYGGPVLDATTALVRLLDGLRDERGELAVPGLHRGVRSGGAGEVGLTEERLRADAGVLDGVALIGTGPLTERLWTAPALTVVALDVPAPSAASNTLRAAATARLSLRVAPGQHPQQAFEALRDHLLATAPWGARVEVELLETAQPFSAEVTGPVPDAARESLAQAWDGAAVVDVGVGGSIPFVADLVEALPGATVLITGVEDPDTRAHGHDESLHLGVLERATLAEALLLTRLRAALG